MLKPEPGSLVIVPVDCELRLYTRKQDGAVSFKVVSEAWAVFFSMVVNWSCSFTSMLLGS
jgi:hypothetical protein